MLVTKVTHMLNSLYVKNFRSLEDFQVSKLGRVNLIVGNNNSGKSSVLEALRIYAGSATRNLLVQIAGEHDEKTRLANAEDADSEFPFEAFFTGRKYPMDDETSIFIGQTESDSDGLVIEHGLLVETEEPDTDEGGDTIYRTVLRRALKSDLDALSREGISQALFVKRWGRVFRLRFDFIESRLRSSLGEMAPALSCSVVPTQFVSIEDLSDEWDKIVLTPYQDIVRQALKIIEPNFEELAFVKSADRNGTNRGRSVKVRLSSQSRPLPLNSMGDGMLRILQLILKVFSAKDGILLIDEFENGLHYSIQSKVWELLFELAVKLNIQVFATTHSWDCIESFAKTAIEKNDVEGVLFRVGRSVRSKDKGRVIATVFDESQLSHITQADVEVR
jgi:predicted ATPase